MYDQTTRKKAAESSLPDPQGNRRDHAPARCHGNQAASRRAGQSRRQHAHRIPAQHHDGYDRLGDRLRITGSLEGWQEAMKDSPTPEDEEWLRTSFKWKRK